MIHQCYFAEAQRARLFQKPVYRGFGLEPEVNPELARNCPELQEARNRPLLCEYAALLHLWRNPELDPDPWIGFSSYRQLDKFPTVFQSHQQIDRLLEGCDIVGWGGYEFFDAMGGAKADRMNAVTTNGMPDRMNAVTTNGMLDRMNAVRSWAKIT